MCTLTNLLTICTTSGLAQYCTSDRSAANNISDKLKCASFLITYSWRVGEWTDCSKTCNAGQPGTRTREVTCSVTSGGIEAEVGDETCAGQKPETREKCALEACQAEWVTTDSGPVSTDYSVHTAVLLVDCFCGDRET